MKHAVRRAWWLMLPVVAVIAASWFGKTTPPAAYAPTLAAAEPAAAADSPPRLTTLCREQADALEKKLGEDCAVVVHEPFVLAGNVSQEQLDQWHQQTIAPAARAMANTYFQAAPSEPITVLLFPDAKSYNRYAKLLFGDAGISIYGYYKPSRRTLVMNIGTGGGTLVHELTHALADFDYPRIPDWFNEGLASLHEQCRFRNGQNGPWIEGLENWRLPILQEAIRAKRLRTLESLIADNDFRGERVGVNYAQARYFCLYLQRKGLLEKFYAQMRSSQRTDPLGKGAVPKILPDVSWDELDADFNAWALELKR